MNSSLINIKIFLLFIVLLFSGGITKVIASDEGETLGFALTWFGPATTENDGDCPAGLAQKYSDEVFLQDKSEEQKALYEDPQGGTFLMAKEKTNRGPGGADVCMHPESIVEDPLRALQGKSAFGLNLTGATDGAEDLSKNTCSHEKFPNGLSGEDYVDNQFQRVIGCMESYRSHEVGGQASQFRNVVEMFNGTHTFLLELTGVNDYQNDDDIEIGFYQGKNSLVQDATGLKIQLDTSLEIVDDSRYHAVVKGKIKDGVVMSTETADIRLHEGTSQAVKPYQQHRDIRFKLSIDDDGNFSGIFAGYKDWLPEYHRGASAGNFNANFYGYTCPTYYEALKQYADGYPDPETGECQAISFAYLIKGVPAFVIHPEIEKVSSAVDFDSADVIKNYSAYMQLPGDKKLTRLSSYSWTSVIPSGVFFGGARMAPKDGGGQFIVGKSPNDAMPTLVSLCGEGSVVESIDVEVPVLEEETPTSDFYYQRYRLEQVSNANCVHEEGAKVEMIFLDFVEAKKIGEPHFLSL